VLVRVCPSESVFFLWGRGNPQPTPPPLCGGQPGTPSSGRHSVFEIPQAAL